MKPYYIRKYLGTDFFGTRSPIKYHTVLLDKYSYTPAFLLFWLNNKKNIAWSKVASISRTNQIGEIIVIVYKSRGGDISYSATNNIHICAGTRLQFKKIEI